MYQPSRIQGSSRLGALAVENSAPQQSEQRAECAAAERAAPGNCPAGGEAERHPAAAGADDTQRRQAATAVWPDRARSGSSAGGEALGRPLGDAQALAGRAAGTAMPRKR